MPEKRYVDLLVVKCGDQLYVAEADSSRIRNGDMVEIEPIPGAKVIGEVIDNAIFDEDGGERYRWIAKLHAIHPVIRSWSLREEISND